MSKYSKYSLMGSADVKADLKAVAWVVPLEVIKGVWNAVLYLLKKIIFICSVLPILNT